MTPLFRHHLISNADRARIGLGYIICVADRLVEKPDNELK